MSIMISSVFIFLNSLKKNSKIISLIFTVFLWTLWGWNYFNADYSIHIGRYNLFETASVYTEPLYTFIISLFQSMGMDYSQFLITVSGILLFSLWYIIVSLSKNPGIVYTALFIYPFSMMVTTQRFSIGLVLLLWGIYFFVLNKWNLGLSLFIVFSILASLIHFSFIFCVIYGLSKLLNLKKIILIVIFGNIFIILLKSYFNLIPFEFISPELAMKIQIFFYNNSISSYEYIIYMFKVVLFFVGFLFLYIIRPQKNVMYNIEILKMNILALFSISLMTYSLEFYRVQYVLYIINYILFSNSLLQNNDLKYFSKKNVVYIFLVYMYALGNLFMWVLSNNNINTVFIPIFKNNFIW